MESKYPNTFYRVSVKALVKNDKGEVLVLKENQDTWSLPGGGLDHGEEPESGLKRELSEELSIQKVTNIEPHGVKTFHLGEKQTWLMWLVYAIQTPERHFELGEGVTEAKFVNPDELSESTDIFEKMVYEVSGNSR
jgi:8-oxo-dGTP pyrophosphatase MutT (NUDIX family)